MTLRALFNIGPQTGNYMHKYFIDLIVNNVHNNMYIQRFYLLWEHNSLYYDLCVLIEVRFIYITNVWPLIWVNTDGNDGFQYAYLREAIFPWGYTWTARMVVSTSCCRPCENDVPMMEYRYGIPLNSIKMDYSSIRILMPSFITCAAIKVWVVRFKSIYQYFI